MASTGARSESREYQSLKRAYIEVHRQMTYLLSFGEINYLCVVKLVEKFDKVGGDGGGGAGVCVCVCVYVCMCGGGGVRGGGDAPFRLPPPPPRTRLRCSRTRAIR